MGTEVLRPHDCLRPAPAPALLPRRRACPTPGHHPKPHRKPSPPARPEARKRREVSPKPAATKKLEAEGGRAGRLADLRAAVGPVEVYAGPSCSLSPSPSSLPLPRFFRKNDGGPLAAVDYSATMDLRRLLRLD